MSVKVSAVTEPVMLGEGPHWSHEHQALFFISAFDKTVHKYVPTTDKHTKSTLDEIPVFIIPGEGKMDEFVVGMKRHVVAIQWDGEDGTAKVLRTVAELDKHEPTNRVNDAKVDPRGRLYAGTTSEDYSHSKFNSSLYRIDPDGQTHVMEKGISLSNGLCWDVKNKAFYYIDSSEYAIRRYDYDIETGNISNRRLVFIFKEHGLDGFADGMTIDTDGNLWVANFNGQQVIKIDPRAGKLLQKVPTPALQTTSLTFGGPNLDILYVTSGSLKLGEDPPPPGGSTYQITGLGVKGHPNLSVKLQ